MPREKKPFSKLISLNVKSRRISLGYTQGDLAEKAGVSENTIAKIESCMEWPKEETLVKIADALMMTYSEMFSATVPSENELKEYYKNEQTARVLEAIDKHMESVNSIKQNTIVKIKTKKGYTIRHNDAALSSKKK